MSRNARSPLVAMNFSGDVFKRPHELVVFNRAAPQNKDWFRIENSAGTDKTLVYIYDEIGYWGTTASDFLQVLSAIDTSEIELHVNSPGGNVWDGIAIYNSLKMHAASVTVYVDALAASAASFIAQAGDKVIVARNAQMMIHDASAFAGGNAADFREVATVLDRISNNIADIYAFNAGGTLEEWRDLMMEETWYSAEEAVTAGLADEMLDQADMEAEAATNKWDLSIFNHAGRKSAPSPEEVMASISNRVKEAQMGDESTPTEPEGTQPEGDQPEGDQPEGTQPPAAPAAPAAPAPVAPAPEPAAAPENKVTLSSPVNVFGVPTTDLTAVQNHIAVLETFRSDTIKNGRTEFITSLASGPAPKIAATQIDDMQKLVDSLSDDQYEMWKGSWNTALPLPALGSHGGGTQEAPGAPAAQASANDQIEIWTETVRQHKIGGMKPENIMQTESYKNLIAAKPEFKL